MNPRWLPAMIPLAVMAGLFPCLVGWRVLGGADFMSLWYPYLSVAQAAFSAHGSVPFWLPGNFGGIPAVESMVPSLYYPTDIVGWLLPVSPPLFYAWDSWLHISLGGIGVFTLARALGAGPAGALFAGLAYAFGGYNGAVLKAGTLVFLRASGLFPWIFLALVRALERPSLPRWAALSAASALLPLTAAYQPFAYLCVLLPLASLILTRNRDNDGTLGEARPVGRVEGLACTLGALAGAGLLSAVTVAPAFRYYLLSMRSQPSDVWRLMDPYPANFLSLFIPAGDPDWKVKYLGLLTGILGAWGFVKARRSAWPWAALGLLALLFAMGDQTPAGRLLSRLPLLGSFRGASHWVALVTLGLAACAALGFDSLFARWSVRRSALALALLGTANCADLVRQAVPLRHAIRGTEYAAALRNDPVAWFLAEQPGDFRTATSESHVLVNMRVPLGLEWVGGYHGAPLHVFQRFYDASTGGCPDVPGLFAWLNARYFVVQKSGQYRFLNPLVKVNSPASGPVWICENPAALPRAFTAREARPADPGDAVMGRLCSESPAGRRIYIHARDGFPTGKLPTGRVASLRRSPNRLEAEVESAGPGMAFFSEAFYPAWTALVDGVRAPVFRANMMFRAVPVPAGKHRVVMSFESIPFKVGLLISLMAWTGLAGVFLRNRSAVSNQLSAFSQKQNIQSPSG